jgi:hypothetical protein
VEDSRVPAKIFLSNKDVFPGMTFGLYRYRDSQVTVLGIINESIRQKVKEGKIEILQESKTK